jgi:rhodanese-related sulfurtransferase
MAHREFKNRLYSQFARIGAALSSEKRLELIDLLGQAPRNVEALAAETEMSVANTSRHLQALRAARLVEAERDGTRVVYRLASDDVLALWLAVSRTADRQLADVGRLARDYAVDGLPDEQLSRDQLGRLLRGDHIVLLDVRPAIEYASGHIPGAVTIPIEELEARLPDLPQGKRIVVYCRGSYCQFADEAVALLRRRGIEALRLEGGWQEWFMEHRHSKGWDAAHSAGSRSAARVAGRAQ